VLSPYRMSTALAAALPLLAPPLDRAIAADVAATEQLGKSTLEKHCARCHAIEREDASPFAQAPPFRDVYNRFPQEELEMRLTEGAVSHYKYMPQIDLTHEQVAAVMAYFASIGDSAP
jgi:mono/diheme cytochrome c family protein